jgi:hypothetical protein
MFRTIEQAGIPWRLVRSFDWRFFFGCIAVTTVLFIVAAHVGQPAARRPVAAPPVVGLPLTAGSPATSAGGPPATAPRNKGFSAGVLRPRGLKGTGPPASPPAAPPSTASSPPVSGPVSAQPPPTAVLICLRDGIFVPCSLPTTTGPSGSAGPR